MKLALVSLLVAAATGLSPAGALAGSLTVNMGAGSAGTLCSQTSLWAAGGMQAYCGDGGYDSAKNAIYLKHASGSAVGSGSAARATIHAPSGIAINNVHVNYCSNMQSGVGWGGGSLWSGGGASWTSAVCSGTSSGSTTDYPNGSSYYGFQLICGWSSCSNYGYVYVPSLTIAATETSGPSLIASSDGSWYQNIWYRGDRWLRGGGWNASLYGSDVSGVCEYQISMDSRQVADSGNQSQTTTTWQQCPNNWTWSQGQGATINTASYGDGDHSYQVADRNAAQNWSQDSTTLHFDNTSPTLAPGASNDSNPDSYSGSNHAVTVYLHPHAGPSGVSSLSCTDNGNALAVAGNSSDGTSNVTVDGNGAHSIACNIANNAVDVWGGDAVGSGSMAVKIDEQTPVVTLSGAPASPAWNSGTPTVTANGAEAIAESGIATTNCSASNQSTSQTVNASAAGSTASLRLPSTGVWKVSCSSTTAAGTTGSASETVQVDQSTPQVALSGGPSQSAWHTTSQQITVSGTATGPSPITQLQCSIGGTSTDYAASTKTITVNPPGGNLVCRSQNAAGTWSPTATWTFLIDSTPPTGSFEPTDPNRLSQVVALVADAQSGVAGGQIQTKQASGWQNVPTSYDLGSGQLTGTLPDDGSVQDGTYQLRALVQDGAGNQGIVTTNTGGIPETVTFPLRAVTQMNVGQSVVYINHCTVRRVAIKVKGKRRVHGQRQPARLVRSCSPVATPRGNGNLQLSFGQAGEVSGLFQTADGYPLAGARLQVTQQAPGWSVQQLGTTTTDAHGRFSYLIAVGPSRTLTFTFPGNGTIRSAGATTTVHVTGSTTINVSPVIRDGRPARISGQVQGGYIPPGGVLVQLQYAVMGTPQGWEPFGQPLHTDKNGAWAMAIGRWPANSAGYSYRIRAVVPDQNGWPYQQALSGTVQRRIKR